MKKLPILGLIAITAAVGFGIAQANENQNTGTGMGEPASQVNATPQDEIGHAGMNAQANPQGATPQTKTMRQAINQRASVTTDHFVHQAAVGNEFEIESSKLALDRSKDANVRDFAQKMIDDHTQANDNLKAALPTDIDQTLAQAKLDAKHQQMYDKLKATPAASFNAAYISAQKNAHKEAVGLFASYANHGDQQDLKSFAQDTLPTLQEHQHQIDSLHPTGAGAVNSL